MTLCRQLVCLNTTGLRKLWECEDEERVGKKDGRPVDDEGEDEGEDENRNEDKDNGENL